MEYNPKIEGLYEDVYQVQCPSPIPSNWQELMDIAIGGSSKSSGSVDAWYRIEKSQWDCVGYEPDDDIIEVTFSYWQKMLLEHREREKRSKNKNKSLPGVEYRSYPAGKSVKDIGDGVIHAVCIEEAKELLKIFDNHGLKWCDGESYLVKHHYTHADQTCYWPADSTQCDLNYFVDEGNPIYRACDVIEAYNKTPIGWKPGCSWRHRDGSCGLSISVHANSSDQYFVDYGEYGTNWISIYIINKNFASGIWVLKDEGTEQTKQTIFNKQQKTNQNAKTEKRTECTEKRISYTGTAAYLPGDQERITPGERRKGLTVRG